MGLLCLNSFIVLAFLFPQSISSGVSTSVISKCPNFEHRSKPQENADSKSEYVRIPGFLMSDFESRRFRLQSAISQSCETNYEEIEINLIGPEPPEVNLSVDVYEEPVVDNLNNNGTAAVASQLYDESFPKLRNYSRYEYQDDGFTYSVDNNDTISSIHNGSEIEEQQPACERKLNRNDVQFSPSGILFHSGEYYWPTEYCIQVLDELAGSLVVQKCVADCSDPKTPCLPLCCHLHEYLDLSSECCQQPLGLKPIFQPVIYEDINRRLSLEERVEPGGILHTAYVSANKSKADNDAVLRPHYVTFKYHNACSDGLPPMPLYFNEQGDSDIGTRIQIRSNGNAAYIGPDRKWHFLDNFCVAGLVNAEDELQDMTISLLYCLDDEEENVHWHNYLLVAAFIFSSAFLLLTVLVYMLLCERQNIHGWTIISFVTSEFFLFVFLSVSYSLALFTSANDTSRSAYCVGSGILAHFFFLSTFSWLTIINLDLWWTFKSLTPLSERSKGRKRFCVYMTFGMGIPITVVSVGLTLQSIYGETQTNVILPDYGLRECFLAKQARGVYLYYIIGVLLLTNCVLISLTFYTIYKFKQSTRMASASSSKSKERSLRLLLKLIVVMGVTWIFEFILWFDNEHAYSNFSWIVVSVDLLNILQAVATFLIFVCKRKIINQLEQKHPALKVLTKPLMRVMAARSSSLMVSSTSSKPTRSTAARSSSVLQGGSRSSRGTARSQKKRNFSTSTTTAVVAAADSKV